MLEKLKKMLKEKEQKRSALNTKAQSCEDVAELRSINDQMTSLSDEIAELRSMIQSAEAEEARAADDQNDDPAAADQRSADDQTDGEGEKRSAGQRMIVGSFGQGAPSVNEEARAKALEIMEKRGADLRENKREIKVDYYETPEERAVSVAGGGLVVETKYSRKLQPKFNEVSKLIDNVNAVPLVGGEAYESGFEVSDGEGGYTAEGDDYTDAEPVYDKVLIGKACITAYAEITKQASKLPNVDYNSKVSNSVRKAIRKKITKQLVIGAGTANTITGIFNAPTNVIPLASDIEVSAIDADTLDTIVFGYGGDEDIEGDAVLILNKQDLAAFNAIRGNDGQKLYKITMPMNGNMGIITSDESFAVPFIINSACPQLSAAGTPVDTYCMAYGKLEAYEMPIFSQLSIMRSDDFKFKSGSIAYRGEIYVGGNVSMYKGFVRIKKVAAV